MSSWVACDLSPESRCLAATSAGGCGVPPSSRRPTPVSQVLRLSQKLLMAWKRSPVCWIRNYVDSVEMWMALTRPEMAKLHRTHLYSVYSYKLHLTMHLQS